MNPIVDSGLTQAIASGGSMGLQLLALRQRQEEQAREDAIRQAYQADQRGWQQQQLGLGRDRLNQDITEWQAKQKAADAENASLLSLGNLSSLVPNQAMPPPVTGPSPEFGKPVQQPAGGASIPFNPQWPKAIQIEWAKEQMANSAAAQRRHDVHREQIDKINQMTDPRFRELAMTSYLSGLSPAEIEKIGTPKFDAMGYVKGLGSQMGPDGSPLYQPNEINEIARWAGGSKRELTPEEIHKARTAANAPTPEAMRQAGHKAYPKGDPSVIDAGLTLRDGGVPAPFPTISVTGEGKSARIHETPEYIALSDEITAARMALDQFQDEHATDIKADILNKADKALYKQLQNDVLVKVRERSGFARKFIQASSVPETAPGPSASPSVPSPPKPAAATASLASPSGAPPATAPPALQSAFNVMDAFKAKHGREATDADIEELKLMALQGPGAR